MFNTVDRDQKNVKPKISIGIRDEMQKINNNKGSRNIF